MTENQYRADYFGTGKAIFPRDKWECHVCLLPYRQMEVFETVENWRFMICQPCKSNIEREEKEIFASRLQEVF